MGFILTLMFDTEDRSCSKQEAINRLEQAGAKIVSGNDRENGPGRVTRLAVEGLPGYCTIGVYDNPFDESCRVDIRISWSETPESIAAIISTLLTLSHKSGARLMNGQVFIKDIQESVRMYIHSGESVAKLIGIPANEIQSLSEEEQLLCRKFPVFDPPQKNDDTSMKQLNRIIEKLGFDRLYKEDIEFSVRTENTLRDAGITSIGQICMLTPEDISRFECADSRIATELREIVRILINYFW
jgi:hypothetical protein